MDYKTFDLTLVEAKAGENGPEFTGLLSTFGNVDEGGDVVIPGAFDRTLRERDFRPLLWSHDTRLPPIGIEKSLVVTEQGLLGTWSLLDTAMALDIYKALKSGALRKMSMGYQAVAVEFDDSGSVRKLLDVELLESSVVNLAMNEQAEIVTVKEKPLVNDDVKFPEYVKQIVDVLEQCATKAGALVERRAEEERELSEANLEAIKSLIGTAGAVSERLEGFIAPPVVEETPPPASALTSPSASKLRLEITRKRLERLGILERSA